MKDIQGYEGLYQVTSCGKVWSYKRKRFLKPFKRKRGYLAVGLYKNGKTNYYYVHRLVAMAYIPNPDNLPQINHKDENKENNALQNLEWCTCEYNINYGNRNQKISKPVYCEELNRIFVSINAAARELDLNSGHISSCCKGKLKTAGGYHWKYVEVI